MILSDHLYRDDILLRVGKFSKALLYSPAIYILYKGFTCWHRHSLETQKIVINEL